VRYVLTIVALSSLAMTSCSQSGSRVPSYQYGSAVSKQAGGSLGIHTLRQGETLWTVAKAYQVDLRDMLDMNKMNAPFKTRIGQRIKIPAPMSYKVRNGDTLYKVSRMFDTTTTDLVRLNNLKAPYTLTARQNLKLPPLHQTDVAVQSTANVMPSYSPSYPAPTHSKIEREELVPVKTQVVAKNETSIHQVKMMDDMPRTGQISFIKPVSGHVISDYGAKPDGLHNDGINIKAARGDAIRAAEQGIVVYRGNQIEGYGNMVLIRHANGFLTAYAHMDKILVRKGDKVRRGQSIGTVGATGNVKTPQLHFEIRKGKDAIDPKTLIRV